MIFQTNLKYNVFELDKSSRTFQTSLNDNASDCSPNQKQATEGEREKEYIYIHIYIGVSLYNFSFIDLIRNHIHYHFLKICSSDMDVSEQLRYIPCNFCNIVLAVHLFNYFLQIIPTNY